MFKRNTIYEICEDVRRFDKCNDSKCKFNRYIRYQYLNQSCKFQLFYRLFCLRIFFPQWKTGRVHSSPQFVRKTLTMRSVNSPEIHLSISLHYKIKLSVMCFQRNMPIKSQINRRNNNLIVVALIVIRIIFLFVFSLNVSICNEFSLRT